MRKNPTNYAAKPIFLLSAPSPEALIHVNKTNYMPRFKEMRNRTEGPPNSGKNATDH
jgi:hypothetical protein